MSYRNVQRADMDNTGDDQTEDTMGRYFVLQEALQAIQAALRHNIRDDLSKEKEFTEKARKILEEFLDGPTNKR